MVSFLLPVRSLFQSWEETSGGFKIMIYFTWREIQKNSDLSVPTDRYCSWNTEFPSTSLVLYILCTTSTAHITHRLKGKQAGNAHSSHLYSVDLPENVPQKGPVS